MFYTYVLKSINHKKFYTGYTDDLTQRLRKHNERKNMYSKRYAPWKIVYHEIFELKQGAIKRERYFKSAAGRRWLKKYVANNV